MRVVLIAGLTAALGASMAAHGQTPPPIEAGDLAPVAAEEPPRGPQPGDRAPAPPPSEHSKDDSKKESKIVETAGGAVTGALAKTAGTAAGGPVAGLAAGVVGNQVGRGAVSLVKRLFGIGDDDDDEHDPKASVEQARAAPEATVDVSAALSDPEPVDPPSTLAGVPEPAAPLPPP